MQTYVATNYKSESYSAASNEKWGYFPDDNPVRLLCLAHLDEMGKFCAAFLTLFLQVRSFYAGDSRAALVPFLAYQALGNTFKWLLYGDDDTLFFLDGLFSMTVLLDHNMPYFISGEDSCPLKSVPPCGQCLLTARDSDSPAPHQTLNKLRCRQSMVV